MTKILHILTDFPFKRNDEMINYGGLGICALQLIEGAKDAGYEVDILTRGDSGIDSELCGGVYRTGYIALTKSRNWKMTHSFTLIPKLLYLLLTKKYDLVHVHNPPAALFAAPMAKLFKIPVVMTMHGPWAKVRDRFKGLAKKIETHSLRYPDVVTFDGEALKGEFESVYGADGRFVAIVNAVDTVKFKRLDKNDCRELLGLPKDKKLILYSGRSVYGKNIHAIQELARLLPDTAFVIAGERINSFGNIINLGVVPNTKMPLVYNACDCLILDSIAEGMSRAVLEAMACGCAVLLSDIPSNREIIGDSGCGRIFSSVEQAAIDITVLSRESMAEMGEKGIERVEGAFRVHDRLYRFIDIYIKLIGKKRQSGATAVAQTVGEKSTTI